MLVKLGSILKVKHGFAFKSKNYVNKGYFRLVTLGNFSENNTFKMNDAKATYYSGSFPKEFILSKDDLVIPLTEQVAGLFGNTALIPPSLDFKFVLNQRVGKIICDENKVNKYYLHYALALESVKKQLEARASGTKQRNISPEDIYDVTIDLPPLEIQNKIVSILSSIDIQISHNNVIVKRLQVLTQAIYNYWFIQYKIPNFKSDLIYNKNLNRKIPLNWKVKKISEVCNIILGGTPSTKIAEYWKGDINWLNSGEIAHFPITKSELKISNLGLKYSATKLMKKGTILVSITGNIRVSILAIDSCANQSVVGIEENDVFEAGYLYPCVKNLIELYEKTSTGNCQKHINKNAIEHSYLLIPPYDILQKYSEYIRPFYKKIYDISLLNEKLLLLKNTLLPLLINQQLT